jgi:hypothetical protein
MEKKENNDKMSPEGGKACSDERPVRRQLLKVTQSMILLQ